MQTYMLIVKVSFINARKVCESVENMTFDSPSSLREFLNKEGALRYTDVLSLSDFMDEVNNQDLDDLTHHFISYVHINN